MEDEQLTLEEQRMEELENIRLVCEWDWLRNDEQDEKEKYV